MTCKVVTVPGILAELAISVLTCKVVVVSCIML